MAPDLACAGERVALVAEDPFRLRIVRRGDNLPIGEVELRNDGPAEGPVIWRLCIEAPHRSYGCGTEASMLLVQALRRAGHRGVWSRAHPHFGLSVYFWFRMGFRPLHGEGPEGGIWFVRDL